MSVESVTEMYDTQEVLALLKISKGTLNRWRKSGKIKSFEFPSQHYRYSREEIDKILKEGMGAV